MTKSLKFLLKLSRARQRRPGKRWIVLLIDEGNNGVLPVSPQMEQHYEDHRFRSDRTRWSHQIDGGNSRTVEPAPRIWIGAPAGQPTETATEQRLMRGGSSRRAGTVRLRRSSVAGRALRP